MGRSPVEVDELVEHWTGLEDEQQLRSGRSSSSRAGAARTTQPAPGQSRGAPPLGSVPLVDILKEAVLRTGCLGTVTSVASGGSIRADAARGAAAVGDLRPHRSARRRRTARSPLA